MHEVTAEHHKKRARSDEESPKRKNHKESRSRTCPSEIYQRSVLVLPFTMYPPKMPDLPDGNPSPKALVRIKFKNIWASIHVASGSP